MELAIITSGFVAGSSSVSITADVADGTAVLVYDDETKSLLGSDVTTDGVVDVTVAPELFEGQRIIAYLTAFGQDTFGAVIVVDSENETTGWKTPETVDGQPYEEYLEAGGEQQPDVYDPANCRNISRDMDAIGRVINTPITFTLRQIESQAGNVQVIIEDVQGAIGGFKTKFDSDVIGTSTSKVYSVNGAYQVKIWGINETEADAVIKTYNLTMPTAVVEFGTTVVDLTYHADYGNATSPGLRPVRVIVYSSVPVEVQIDGVHTWAIASGTGSAPGETGRYEGPVHFVDEGEYTIRCRKLSDGLQLLVRQIKLNNYFS
ncbi:hypothetical protein GCM10007423_39880 [Dyadobacter endophyticus]|uniref:Uncharacterized protein n=1 Tax=Dyadobacter endophyticus TaxID=1749036 RepID=A0ABQ1YYU7_9BACT|nr:hypothetical protein [Dyadobacter endophyticus]GGH42903.1 hypothetical protein GCM10007423_39880 [Dyadobacter endophyticus]